MTNRLDVVPVQLGSLRRDAAAEYGGKAAMLGEMGALGVPVFNGVALPAQTYRDVVHDSGAERLVERFWADTDPVSAEGEDRLGALRDEIRSKLAAHDLTPLAASLLEALDEVHAAAPRLIVRSSATVEDGRSTSYAGQFESCGCDATADDLAAALTAVYTSCTSPHVAAYRSLARERASPGNHPAMGVVVQPLAAFTLSGLLFTSHPTVALRGWMLLEYLDAQPSQLVAGEVSPHRCRVTPNLRRAWERRIRGRTVLSDEQTRMLVDLAVRLRSHFATELDIEWGAGENDVRILQARPATTTLA